MEKITTVGLDLAKQVMAAHAVDSGGRMVTRKVVRRDQLPRWTATLPQCVVAMEACGGAHYWARELTRQGHTVRTLRRSSSPSLLRSGVSARGAAGLARAGLTKPATSHTLRHSFATICWSRVTIFEL
jgi:transposase